MRLAIEEGEDQIYVMCDSSYAMNACENHHEKSLNRTWYNQNGSRMLNQSVVKDIYHLYDEVEVRFKKVAAHNGDYGNEKADDLAREGCRLPLEN